MTGEKGERTAAVVLAAGQGKRMQSGVAKQYLLLKGKPVIWKKSREILRSVIIRI